MLVVAHRTPRTRSGCEDLVTAGATIFECDVQLRGGTVVVSHFLPFLRRRGWLEHDNGRFRWRQGIRRRDLTLREVVAMVPARCGILLDPKETDMARRARLIDEVARVLPDRSRFRVSTDRLDDLAGYRAAGFDTWLTIKSAPRLVGAVAAGELPDAGVSVRHTLLDPDTTAALHRVTGTVVAWTVNDAGRARRLAEDGVDGITTDSHDVMRAMTGR